MSDPQQPLTTALSKSDATPSPTAEVTSMLQTDQAGVFLPYSSILAPPQSEDEIGRLGNYRILSKIGEGGMGFVFAAEDLRLKRRVALKAMRPEIAAIAESKGRFLREAQAAAALASDHVVTIYHVDEHNSVPFLVMPLMSGETLHDRLKRNDRPTLLESLRIGRQTAHGLAAAHAQGLVHRDIKPSNLWLEDLGPDVPGAPRSFRVRILDFGLARQAQSGEPITRTGQVLGTPQFIAPEQARALGVDSRADLFSLGSVLYLLVAGRRAFQGSDVYAVLASMAFDKLAPPHEINPAVPPALSHLLLQLLQIDPAARPASTTDVLAELIGLEAQVAQSSAGLTRPPSAAELAAPELAVSMPLPSRVRPARPPLLSAPFAESAARAAQRAWSEHLGKPIVETYTLGKSAQLQMVLIPPGEYAMGSPPAEQDEYKQQTGFSITDERQRTVTISRPVYFGRHTVTQEQFEAVLGRNPAWFSRRGGGRERVRGQDTRHFPVDSVSWHDAVEFCERLTRDLGVTFDLPREVEWEYACRAGTASAFHFGARLDGWQGNCDGNFPFGGGAAGPFLERTGLVGSYAANAFGLFDMHGNVWEWCSDAEAGDSQTRVLRGGSWGNRPADCRSANRDRSEASGRFYGFGFRVCRRVG